MASSIPAIVGLSYGKRMLYNADLVTSMRSYGTLLGTQVFHVSVFPCRSRYTGEM